MSLDRKELSRARSAAAISAAIEAAIRRGDVAPGERLPPIRALATHTGVSHVTAAAAYRRLRERALVVGSGRGGTRVAAQPPIRIRVAAPLPPGVRDLEGGNPDPSMLPTLPTLAHPHVLYGANMNDPRLLSLVRTDFLRDGVPADDLAIAGGALDAVERILSSYLRTGDRVGIEDPGYPRLFDLLTALRLVPYPLPVDEYGPKPQALEAALARGVNAVVLTPRAHNPTGAAYSSDRARALAAILGHHRDTLLIEDDHAHGVAGAPLYPLAGATEHWAYVRSFALSLGPDLRVATVAGDEVTISRLQGRQIVGAGWVSHMLQRTAAALLASAKSRRIVERAQGTYLRRREALVAALADVGIVAWARSGLSVWVPVAEEAPVVRFLLTAGYAVAPGERFRLASPPGVRIAVACLNPREAPAVAAAFADALRPSPRTYSA